MKKVLIITYYWPPSGGAGVQRWLKFAKYLPEHGVEPYILTVDPRYASYPQIDESLEIEVPEGLNVFKTKSFEVLRILSGVFGKENIPYGGFTNVDERSLLQILLRSIRGNFFIPDARAGWNRYAFKQAIEIIENESIDTVITTGPPHSTHLTGLKLKSRMKLKWIADFRDPWTDIYYYSDLLHTPVARKIDRLKEKSVLENADRVIANCNSNKELLMSKISGKQADKFSVITNGYDEDDFAIPVKPSDSFTITYSGTMSGHYRPDVFFRAFSKLISRYPEISFRFRIAGNISPSTERQVKAHGLYGIFEYPGYVSHPRLTEYLKGSSALLYIFPETEKDRGIAGKLFEYLAAQKPVIAIGSTESDASRIIAECEAGKTFSREDETGLLDYLNILVNSFKSVSESHTGNNEYRKYSRRNLCAHLARIIGEL